MGESLDPRSPAARRPEVAHFETYNPVVAADQMQDLATVVAWSRSQPDVLGVNLVGQAMAGPQALVARPVLDGVARTAIELKDLPDPRSSGPLPSALDLPGLFQFGGCDAAAALVAPAPLWIHAVRETFHDAPARAAYALSGVDRELRQSPHTPDAAELARWLDQGE